MGKVIWVSVVSIVFLVAYSALLGWRDRHREAEAETELIAAWHEQEAAAYIAPFEAEEVAAGAYFESLAEGAGEETERLFDPGRDHWDIRYEAEMAEMAEDLANLRETGRLLRRVAA